MSTQYLIRASLIVAALLAGTASVQASVYDQVNDITPDATAPGKAGNANEDNARHHN